MRMKETTRVRRGQVRKTSPHLYLQQLYCSRPQRLGTEQGRYWEGEEEQHHEGNQRGPRQHQEGAQMMGQGWVAMRSTRKTKRSVGKTRSRRVWDLPWVWKKNKLQQQQQPPAGGLPLSCLSLACPMHIPEQELKGQQEVEDQGRARMRGVGKRKSRRRVRRRGRRERSQISG